LAATISNRSDDHDFMKNLTDLASRQPGSRSVRGSVVSRPAAASTRPPRQGLALESLRQQPRA
jgi:hypothetical protein